jgi:hypothetical protein
MYITAPFSVATDLQTMRKAQTALAGYMKERYLPTSMMCDTYATQAEADARVEWLVNYATYQLTTFRNSAISRNRSFRTSFLRRFQLAKPLGTAD